MAEQRWAGGAAPPPLTGRGYMLIGPALGRPNKVALIGGQGHIPRTPQPAASAALWSNCKLTRARAHTDTDWANSGICASQQAA